MGDFNWITQHFLAFASPQQQPVTPTPANTPEYDALPSTVSEVCSSKLPLPFKNVLVHFATRNVGLVVRLNSELSIRESSGHVEDSSKENILIRRNALPKS